MQVVQADTFKVREWGWERRLSGVTVTWEDGSVYLGQPWSQYRPCVRRVSFSIPKGSSWELERHPQSDAWAWATIEVELNGTRWGPALGGITERKSNLEVVIYPDLPGLLLDGGGTDTPSCP